MPRYNNSDIAGFRSPLGTFCASCWINSERRIDNSVKVLLLKDKPDNSVCDQCGKKLWG
jgi:hypothetical protein